MMLRLTAGRDGVGGGPGGFCGTLFFLFPSQRLGEGECHHRQ